MRLIVNMGALDQWAAGALDGLRKSALAGVYRASVEIRKEQTKLAPIDHGSLRASIHARAAAAEGWRFEGGTSADVHYAFFQEYGTGSKGDAVDADGNTIRHTSKPGWYFADPTTGEQRLGRPMEGRHFMRDGLREGADRATAELRACIVRGLTQ